jgi:hypothetical protein
MSQEMRLRVAKAIHKEMTGGRDWESEAPTTKDFYLGCAAAGIPAMRDPTEGMMAAIDCGGEKRSFPSGRMWTHIYNAMVDEAAK